MLALPVSDEGTEPVYQYCDKNYENRLFFMLIVTMIQKDINKSLINNYCGIRDAEMSLFVQDHYTEVILYIIN